MRCVAVSLLLGERRVVPAEFQVRLEIFVGHMKRDMRYHRWVVAEEWPVLVGLDEVQNLFVDAIGSVICSLKLVVTPRVRFVVTWFKVCMTVNSGIVIQFNNTTITTQKRRVVAVGMGLAKVAKETVESLI